MNLATAPAMTKKGRPPKTGHRFPNGELKPVRDTGTADAIAKRIQLAGNSDTGLFFPNGQPRTTDTLAHYPLGVALARNVISLEQHDAGLEYVRSYILAMDGLPARLQPSLARFLPAGSGEAPETARYHATLALRACTAALMTAGRSIKDEVDRTCVFGIWPYWQIRQRPPSATDIRHQHRLIAGLNVLVRTLRA